MEPHVVQALQLTPLFVIDRSLFLTQCVSCSVRLLVRTEKTDEEGLWVTEEGEGQRPHVSVLVRSSLMQLETLATIETLHYLTSKKHVWKRLSLKLSNTKDQF